MDKNVEVFRTNIRNLKGADRLKKELSLLYPSSEVDIDLEDCDNILRIEARTHVEINQIISLGHTLGIILELLED